MVAAGTPPFRLSEATNWLGNWFPRGTGRIPKISGLCRHSVSRRPVTCRQRPWSDSSHRPWASPRPLSGVAGWGRSFCGASLSRLSAALSLSVCHSEVNRWGERSGWLVEREKEACPCQGGVGGKGGGGRGRVQLLQPLHPPSLQLLSPPREFQPLLILGPG